MVAMTRAAQLLARRFRSSPMCSRIDISPAGLARWRRWGRTVATGWLAAGWGVVSRSRSSAGDGCPVASWAPLTSLASPSLEASVTPFLNSLMPRPRLRPIAGSRLAPKSMTIARMTQIHSGPGIAQLLRIVRRRTLASSLPLPPALRQAGAVGGGLLAGLAEPVQLGGVALAQGLDRGGK